MKLFEALRKQTELLASFGVENAAGDARALMLHSFELTPEKYAIEKNEPCDDARLELFEALCQRRADGYPLQYILGSWDFCGREFFVGEDCLIPREETELIVRLATKLGLGECGFADLCTGSGCIGISYALENTASSGVLCDISDGALRIAGKNAEHHGVTDRVDVRKFDVFCDVLPDKVSLIMSNPPYINERDMESLAKELHHEPHIALYGGKDGLDFYRCICKKHIPSLLEGGYIIFEVGYDQADAVFALLSDAGLTDIQIFTDLYGVRRAVMGKKG